MGEGLFQPAHLILIMMLALILFGAGKLGDVGAALGKSVREFRHGLQEPGETALSPDRQCSECGRAVQETDRFCAHCGASLGANKVA